MLSIKKLVFIATYFISLPLLAQTYTAPNISTDGASGTNILPLDNIFTGSNSFLGPTSFNGGITANAPSAGATIFTFADTSRTTNTTIGYAPNFSINELLFTNTAAAQNTISLRNTSAAGFGALTVRDDSGNEVLAIGKAGSTTNYFDNGNYIETSCFGTTFCQTAPPTGFSFITTGYQRIFGGTSAYRSTRRWQLFGQDGIEEWYAVPGNGISNTTMRLDPYQNFVGINTKLMIGNGTDNSQTPYTALDVRGIGLFGLIRGNAQIDGIVAPLTVITGSAPMQRFVKAGVGKVDYQINGAGTARSLDLIDTDNFGGLKVHSVSMAGTGVVSNLHYGAIGVTPTIAAGTGAGGSPISLSLDAGAHDSGFDIILTTGSSPVASAVIATVTFSLVYPGVPHCAAPSPKTSDTAALSGTSAVVIGTSASTYTLTAGSTPLAASTNYRWSIGPCVY